MFKLFRFASHTVSKTVPVFHQQKRFVSATVQRTGDFENADPKTEDEVVHITYVQRDGTERKIRGKVGDNILFLAQRYGIEMDGACEASIACSTCHVYIENGFYDKVPEPIEEEDDMLDMALALKSNSRLGCQIYLSKDLDGLRVVLPAVTHNYYADDGNSKPK